MSRELLQMVFDAMSYGNAEDRESARLAVKAVLEEQPAPPECETEAEKTAFAFGWWKALEAQRAAPVQEPKCAVIVEVFGKDWRLDYMSLPVGKHKLYTQQYVYTTPPAAQPNERDIRNAALDEIAAKIALMPFGDTAASFAVWIKEQKT
jgi:hypothetical protein